MTAVKRMTIHTRQLFIFVILALIIWVSYLSLYNYGPKVFEDVKSKVDSIEFGNLLDNYQGPPQRWLGCPKAGDGLNSIMISSYFHGRLGNQIWEYLSAWAIARHYGIWPVVPNASLVELNTVFEDLSVPSLEELGERCGFSDQVEKMHEAPQEIGSQETLLMEIENPKPNQLNYLRLPVYVVHTEEVLPWWRELRREMRIKSELREQAQNLLHTIDFLAHNQTRLLQFNETSLKNSSYSFLFGTSYIGDVVFEFVGIHVRRTDYLSHVVNNYPGAKAADERYFHHAMEWLRKQLKRPLVFVVVSDDLKWCREHLTAPDVFVVGTGDESSPGSDLALLAACNYTIFSYGTFGLTAAMLVNGRYTLLYDTQNMTNTKEMEFATYLPGWHILDDDGNEHYHPAQRAFQFTFVKG